MLLHALIDLPDKDARRRLKQLVKKLECVPLVIRNSETLWERLHSETVDVIFMDREAILGSLEETIGGIRALPGEPDVVIIATVDEASDRARLLAAGCLGFLSPELTDDELKHSLQALLERRREAMRLKLKAEATEEYRLGDFVSSSPSMQPLIEISKRVAESDTTALILGETGVGKEFLARALHAEGLRSTKPFVAVNCAAIPGSLFESELFGHRQGAFTGATRDHRGYFEMAHGGTVFLDEIGELSPHLQVKLLRVLQERIIQQVGSERTFEVDVRLLAATNRNPKQEIQAGRLREELYYRLGVVELEIPPLRQRREDIPDLVENYCEIFSAKIGRRLTGIQEPAKDALVAYGWPGNVRELINVMERAVLLASTHEITLADLPREIGVPAMPLQGTHLEESSVMRSGETSVSILDRHFSDGRREVLQAFERQYLAALLQDSRGRVGEAAEQAGLSTRTLYEKMKLYGIRKEDYRWRRGSPRRLPA